MGVFVIAPQPPLPPEKSVPLDTVDLAGDQGIRFSAIMSVFLALLVTLRSCARSRAVLQLKVLALRHQLQVLNRSRPRQLRLAQADRLPWVWLSHLSNGWREGLVIVKPETVIAWHRRAFRLFWSWKSRRRIGRSSVAPDLRALIRRMSDANPRWGVPRIHGELLKRAMDVSQSTVAKYLVHRRHPHSQTWHTFWGATRMRDTAFKRVTLLHNGRSVQLRAALINRPRVTVLTTAAWPLASECRPSEASCIHGHR